jgi:NAD(P)-dependent dehydrogenase (short-subunit alcohol dehydrogenase family)
MAGSMAGKTVLVTGATQGIGREAALAFAKMGARVGVVGRDATRAREAAEYVKAAVPGAQVDIFLADLSLMADVRKLADEVKAIYSELHVLLNNAGAIFTDRKTTSEGLEQTFALNHMSYFLLTNLLLELLQKSAPARVVSVSSDAHQLNSFNLADLQSEKSYGGMKAYGASKLENILFTRELARRLEGTGVTANCLHPGVIASGFGKNNGGLFGALLKVGNLFMTTPEKGARTSVYVATSEEGGKVSGAYFNNSKQAKTAKVAQDAAVAKQLWDESAKLAGIPA